MIVNILNGNEALSAKGKLLIDAANEAGGKDNITVVLVANTAKSVKQKATKPISPVKKNEEPKDELRKDTVVAPIQTSIRKDSHNKHKGVIGLLSLLCLILLGAVVWMWWQWRKDKETQVAPMVTTYIPNEGAQILQDTINRLSSDTLSLTAAVQIGDTIFIDRDSFYLKGNGISLTKDTSNRATHAIIKLQPSIRYFMLDSVILQNVIIGVEATNMEAVHFKNVVLQNSFVQLIQGFHYGDSILTGTLSDMNMRHKDSLPKKR
jgi:hypothetical protein